MRLLFENQFEKAGSDDANNIQLTIHQSIFDDFLYNFFGTQSGVLGSGFGPSKTGALTASLGVGVGFFYDSSQAGYNPKYRMIKSASSIPVTFGAANTQDRIDLVSLAPNFVVTATALRWVKTGGVGPIVQQTVNKIYEDSYTLTVTSGTPSGSPVAPSLPSGHIAIATAYIHASIGMTSPTDIVDIRNVLSAPASNVGHTIATGTTIQAQLDEIDSYLTHLGMVAATLAGTQDGVNAVFTLSTIPFSQANVSIYIDGEYQAPTIDWTYALVGGVPKITFVTAPSPGQKLVGWVLSATDGGGGGGGGGGGPALPEVHGSESAPVSINPALGIVPTNAPLQVWFIMPSAGSGQILISQTPPIAAGFNVGQVLKLISVASANYLRIPAVAGVTQSGPVDFGPYSQVAVYIWGGLNWILQSTAV